MPDQTRIETPLPEPLLTVIIPTYNRPIEVRNAAKSALNQTLEGVEVIVIDDGSVAPTILEPHPRLRQIFSENNIGGAAIRNRAAREAKGRWICFLDDDDLLMPNFAEVSIDAITATTDLPPPLVVLSGKQTVDSSGRLLYTEFAPTLPKGRHYWLENLPRGTSAFCKQTMVIGREEFLALGGFDPTQVCRIHSELFFRLNLRCSILGIRDVTYTQIEHSGARVSSNASIRKQGFDQLIEKHRNLFNQHPRKFAWFYRQQARISRRSGQLKNSCEEYFRALTISPRHEVPHFLRHELRPLARKIWRRIIKHARLDGSKAEPGKTHGLSARRPGGSRAPSRVHNDAKYLNSFSTVLPGEYREQVVIVGSEAGGFKGPGKVSALAWFQKFQYWLHLRGVGVLYVPTPEALLAALSSQKASRIVCAFVYDEAASHANTNQFNLMADFEAREDILFFNGSRTGSLIADKEKTLQALATAHIAAPLRAGAGASPPFFCAPKTGSRGTRGTVVASASEVPPHCLATEFIDTRQSFEGEEYHTSVRLLAVGSTLVDAWVRAAPAKYGQVTAQSSDTPLNPELIGYLHNKLVVEKMDQLTGLTAKLGQALGLGFYTHDLLYSVTKQCFLVGDTGFRFDDPGYRARLLPISTSLPFLEQHFSQRQIDLSAEAFLLESQRAGFLLSADPP